MPKRLNQAGDTIVEVLIAVVVVGLAIGLGYGVASRSLKANQQSQERSEALKKVEGQLERLKKRAVTDANGSGVFSTNASQPSFCIVDTPTEQNRIEREATPPANVSDDPLGNAYNAACVDGRYHLSITPTINNADTKQFVVTARWFGIGGLNKEQTTVTYRIYPGTQ